MNRHARRACQAFLLAAVACCGVFLAASSALAKRGAPDPVPSVAVAGIEYSAPHARMGVVVATDLRTRKELWRKRIYRVAIDPALERDVQQVFIASLVLEGDTLVIVNERGQRFRLDLRTGTIVGPDASSRP